MDRQKVLSSYLLGFYVNIIRSSQIIISKISGKVPRPPNGGTVMGTIDDLSDDEKTRAFLQLLEYKLRMEKEQVPH